jgi:hypothetical protein
MKIKGKQFGGVLLGLKIDLKTTPPWWMNKRKN